MTAARDDLDDLSGLTGPERLLAVIKKFGLETFIVLFILGTWTGFLPSPLSRAMEKHDHDTQVRIERLETQDKLFTESLSGVSRQLSANNRINRLLVCLVVANDEKAQSVCLREHEW